MFKWTFRCFGQFFVFYNDTSRRGFSTLPRFPTAFRMIFTFLRIVFESLSMFCRLCLSHLMPFFLWLTVLRPRDFLTISWAQKIVPLSCFCCSVFWNSFPMWVSCLLPLSPQGPIWMPAPRRSLRQPCSPKEAHPLWPSSSAPRSLPLDQNLSQFLKGLFALLLLVCQTSISKRTKKVWFTFYHVPNAMLGSNYRVQN